MRLRSSLVAAVVVAISAGPAWAEEEVRIAIVAGKAKVRIAATKLAVYDGDSGDRVTWSPEGQIEVRAAAAGAGVEIAGAKPIRARRFMIEGDPGVRVEGRLYLGRIAVELESGGKTIIAINRLPLETYLLGIVGSEMSPEWPMEALKAQAVAARTYALQRRMMMRAADKPYDLESSVLSQVYEGAERIRPSVVAAVVATRGEVIAYKHRLAEALFHSTCGGLTVSARQAFGNNVPYLVPQKCKWCNESNKYRWAMSLGLDKVTKALRSAKLINAKAEVIDLDRDDPNGPVVVKLKSGAPQKLSAKSVRAAIGYMVVMSDRFTASSTKKEVALEGMGFGHGVGMCQWGAKGLSDRGMSHREILEHYYKGAEVKRIY